MTETIVFLQEWNEAKMKISDLERKCERYKRLADGIMNKRGVDVIKSGDLTVKRKEISRTSISKPEVPKEIWNKYCKQVSYTAYYLTETL
jgi:hypothetical protein